MRTIWTSNPRPPSTNDGPRGLVLFCGFQRQATTILKRRTPVTLCLCVKRALHLKKKQSRLAIPRRSPKHGGPACEEKSRKAKSKGHENRWKLSCPCRRRRKVAVLSHRSICGALSNNRDSHDGLIEVVVRMRDERTLDSSSGSLSRVDCL